MEDHPDIIELKRIVKGITENLLGAMETIRPAVQAINQSMIDFQKAMSVFYREWYASLPLWFKCFLWEQAEINARKDRHRRKYQRMMSRKNGSGK